VTTFKTIAAIADFESAAPVKAMEVREATAAPAGTKSADKTQRDLRADDRGPARPAININIQLQLPATEDGTIYDKLFAALKKHLFS
jgi:hypothetical protein